jgi:GNAT superfamily N-acetyltransferase
MSFILSDDKMMLDIHRIHGWLASSYWSPGIELALVKRAISGSHCLGAYKDDEQVGFARTITDYATFAWLADIWVDEGVRGQGLGRDMVDWFTNHEKFSDIRRFALTTKDAHGVYAKVGFHPLIRPQNLMERLSPDYTAMLKAAS